MYLRTQSPCRTLTVSSPAAVHECTYAAILCGDLKQQIVDPHESTGGIDRGHPSEPWYVRDSCQCAPPCFHRLSSLGSLLPKSPIYECPDPLHLPSRPSQGKDLLDLSIVASLLRYGQEVLRWRQLEMRNPHIQPFLPFSRSR
ncbi:hypothetical protein GW17_00049898 [Ensete ventricosum]|nr:hypothetical protein GW17_00049898 [Ensete ventricosum]